MLTELIARETGLDQAFIENLARTANYRYKIYIIPKRTVGERIIQHPSRQLKFLQRWFVNRIFRALPVHSAATAYMSGTSVRNNAALHVNNNYLLKLDFENFFPSIKKEDVERHLRINRHRIPFELDADDVQLISNTVTRKGAIVIGAPSSPIISNQIMYEFDVAVHQYCAERGVSYSRYADDMYFSTRVPNTLSEIHNKVIRVISDLAYPRLSLNREKTSHSSKKRKRLVTGLSLTSDGKVSLGRKKKRMVRSLIHKHKNDELEPEQRNYLAGYLSYAKSVEPIFIERLVAKFGANAVASAMKIAD